MPKIKRLIIEIPVELHTQIKTTAYAEGKTIKNKIVELITEWFKNAK